LAKQLSQLIIRFDTKPDYYTKKDYQLLIGVLTGALTYLYNNSGSESDIAELLEKLEGLQAELNDLKKDVGDISSDISSINETIF
jgi:peptidoglycan hydrolase CwlO-like protein